jgi:hypothetical protein
MTMLMGNLTQGSARTMAVLGLIFAAIAAALAGFWLGLDSSSRSTSLPFLLSMFPTFAILGLVFMWVAGARGRLHRFIDEGIRGRATIKNLILTGTRINEIPVLKMEVDVTIPGRPTYAAADKVVAYPGTVPNSGTYECVVDPGKPDKVKVLLDKPVLPEGVVLAGAGPAGVPSADIGSVLSGALGGNVAGAVAAGSGMQRASAAELLRTGRRGKGSIVQTFPTGMELEDGDNIVGFVIDVVPDDGATAFRAMMAHRVPDSAVARAVPGQTLSVSYDPADPSRRVAIDWSRS